MGWAWDSSLQGHLHSAPFSLSCELRAAVSPGCAPAIPRLCGSSGILLPALCPQSAVPSQALPLAALSSAVSGSPAAVPCEHPCVLAGARSQWLVFLYHFDGELGLGALGCPASPCAFLPGGAVLQQMSPSCLCVCALDGWGHGGLPEPPLGLPSTSCVHWEFQGLGQALRLPSSILGTHPPLPPHAPGPTLHPQQPPRCCTSRPG